MAPSTQDEERRDVAEKREFVADSRDATADDRDRLADLRDRIAHARESLADTREAEQDRREAHLDARAQALGHLVDAGGGAAARADDRAARVAAGQDRDAAGRLRGEAGLSRDEATRRRLSADRPTQLALAFAEIADQLYDADTYDQVLTRIAEVAVVTVSGGDAASITLHGEGGYRTVGATSDRANQVDHEQYVAGEGPCLDAFDAPHVDVPSFPDERWPVLGGHPVEHGVESSVSYRLPGGSREDGARSMGSLNVYGTTPEAFDASAIEIGSILAAHASLAARAVGERVELADLGSQLQRALLSRDVIGQAKGILIERLRATPEEAFEILKRSSQRLNVKLRDVAQRLTETGEIPVDVGRHGR